MRYRLDEQHYLNDCLVEAGTEIGDGTPYTFRYSVDTRVVNNGKPEIIKAGTALPPSRAMTPLDAEAKAMFDKQFPGLDKPPIDPTAKIPIMGNVKETASVPSRGPIPEKPAIPVGSPLTKA